MPSSPRPEETARSTISCTRSAHRCRPSWRERLRAGAAPNETSALPRLATGIAALDALLGGGFPRGRVSEITGPLSSGRTALALRARSRRRRATARSPRWSTPPTPSIRIPPPPRASISRACCGRVRRVRAKPCAAPSACSKRAASASWCWIRTSPIEPAPCRRSASIWLRMSRSATASGTALVLVASSTRAGPFAALSLEARATRVHFATRPDWLEGSTRAWCHFEIGWADPRGAWLCSGRLPGETEMLRMDSPSHDLLAEQGQREHGERCGRCGVRLRNEFRRRHSEERDRRQRSCKAREHGHRVPLRRGSGPTESRRARSATQRLRVRSATAVRRSAA